MFTTLYCQVGKKTDPHPIFSVSHKHPHYEDMLDAEESRHRQQLLNGGVAATRIQFTRETKDTSGTSAKPAKKGS